MTLTTIKKYLLHTVIASFITDTLYLLTLSSYNSFVFIFGILYGTLLILCMIFQQLVLSTICIPNFMFICFLYQKLSIVVRSTPPPSPAFFDPKSSGLPGLSARQIYCFPIIELLLLNQEGSGSVVHKEAWVFGAFRYPPRDPGQRSKNIHVSPWF